jgi:nucleolar pre-ribosomal-associated protein 1
VAQTLRVLRHSVQGSDENGKAARVPSLAALFFAHSLRSIANPAHFLYPVASRFLLQRPKFDMQDVPLLYGMLYAGGEGWKKERGWIVRLIRDGMRSEAVRQAHARKQFSDSG